MSPETARAIVAALRTPAKYVAGKGGECPLCHAWAKVRAVRGRKRYHDCSRCECTFHTEK